MNDLAHDLITMCRRNRDGSHSTQAVRQRGLIAVAKDLQAIGFKPIRARNIKPKHVFKLIEYWQAQGIKSGTLKNRMGWIRWWTKKVNKASILPRTNKELGIEAKRRCRQSKAQPLSSNKKLPDQRMQLVLELMDKFGLRFEEALKLRPGLADQKTVLKLKPSWTKGGRGRDVPIRTKEQRKLLNRIAKVAGSGSLIPPNKSYIQFRKAMENELFKSGIKNVHGLRHQYVQTRYKELTGWACPYAGGPSSHELTEAERVLDRQVRLLISEEIGHSRVEITKVYLG